MVFLISDSTYNGLTEPMSPGDRNERIEWFESGMVAKWKNDPHDDEVVTGMKLDCKTAYGSAAYGCEHYRSST